MEYPDVSRRTVYKIVDDLEPDGVIEEVTGKERGKQSSHGASATRAAVTYPV